MRFRATVLAATLLLPASALADPITVGGSWIGTVEPVTDPSQGGITVAPFWSGLSWDCDTCGVGYLINAFSTEGLEYLHDGAGRAAPFRFDTADPVFDLTYLGGITMWTNGVLGRRADGAFTYDSGTGSVSNSWDNPGQYALFRLVGETSTTYFLGIEDILVTNELNDHDHNDFIVSFTQPSSVPEPSSLLLMGCAIAGLAVRKVRSSRRARA
jgi:PEP-CTERM motif